MNYTDFQIDPDLMNPMDIGNTLSPDLMGGTSNFSQFGGDKKPVGQPYSFETRKKGDIAFKQEGPKEDPEVTKSFGTAPSAKPEQSEVSKALMGLLKGVTQVGIPGFIGGMGNRKLPGGFAKGYATEANQGIERIAAADERERQAKEAREAAYAQRNWEMKEKQKDRNSNPNLLFLKQKRMLLAKSDPLSPDIAEYDKLITEEENYQTGMKQVAPLINRQTALILGQMPSVTTDLPALSPWERLINTDPNVTLPTGQTLPRQAKGKTTVTQKIPAAGGAGAKTTDQKAEEGILGKIGGLFTSPKVGAKTTDQKAGGYKTADEVKAAYDAKKIDRATAKKLIKKLGGV